MSNMMSTSGYGKRICMQKYRKITWIWSCSPDSRGFCTEIFLRKVSGKQKGTNKPKEDRMQVP